MTVSFIENDHGETLLRVETEKGNKEANIIFDEAVQKVSSSMHDVGERKYLRLHYEGSPVAILSGDGTIKLGERGQLNLHKFYVKISVDKQDLKLAMGEIKENFGLYE